MSDVPARYSAFISYAREDERAARWLQRRIEAYRLPQRLRGSSPGRLPPVFRDRDELSASADLEAALRSALGESAWLIVICTPAAAASAWVAREIEMFQDLHGPEQILTALFDGDPDTAFADILRSADGEAPLAADFRTHGDGRRLGSLKLIARLAGVRLDDLVHRDAGRRSRRFGVAALAATVLAVGMAALALVAVRAQAAAEVQRNKAEGFVEFMLTDLRKQLKGVGKLELLTAVNKRALAYYDGMDLARLPPDSLERRAALLHAMGEDDEKRGNLALATRQWEEARRTTAALLAAAPGDAKRVFAHSQSEYWVGFAAWRSGDLRKAKAAFLAYARLTGELRRLDPRNLDFAMEQGYALSNLGTFTLRALGQPSLAKSQFLRSLKVFDEVAKRRGDAEVLIDISDGYGWLGDTQRHLRDFTAARFFRNRQKEILEFLIRDRPDNAELRNRALANTLAQARIDVAAGNIKIARNRLISARPEAQKLAHADPMDMDNRDRARVIELVIAYSWILDKDTARQARIDELTRFCRSVQHSPSGEVIDLCRLIRRRAGLTIKDDESYPLDTTLNTGAFSLYWGFDLANESP